MAEVVVAFDLPSGREALALAARLPGLTWAKLGPVLIQLPPFFEPANDETALRDFLFDLPDAFSFAVEFRHPEWHQPRIGRARALQLEPQQSAP